MIRIAVLPFAARHGDLSLHAVNKELNRGIGLDTALDPQLRLSNGASTVAAGHCHLNGIALDAELDPGASGLYLGADRRGTAVHFGSAVEGLGWLGNLRNRRSRSEGRSQDRAEDQQYGGAPVHGVAGEEHKRKAGGYPDPLLLVYQYTSMRVRYFR